MESFTLAPCFQLQFKKLFISLQSTIYGQNLCMVSCRTARTFEPDICYCRTWRQLRFPQPARISLRVRARGGSVFEHGDSNNELSLVQMPQKEPRVPVSVLVGADSILQQPDAFATGYRSWVVRTGGVVGSNWKAAIWQLDVPSRTATLLWQRRYDLIRQDHARSI